MLHIDIDFDIDIDWYDVVDMQQCTSMAVEQKKHCISLIAGNTNTILSLSHLNQRTLWFIIGYV